MWCAVFCFEILQAIYYLLSTFIKSSDRKTCFLCLIMSSRNLSPMESSFVICGVACSLIVASWSTSTALKKDDWSILFCLLLTKFRLRSQTNGSRVLYFGFSFYRTQVSVRGVNVSLPAVVDILFIWSVTASRIVCPARINRKLRLRFQRSYFTWYEASWHWCDLQELVNESSH